MLSLGTRGYREAEHLAALLDRGFRAAWGRAVEQEAKGADLGTVLRGYLRDALAEDLACREATPGRPIYATTLHLAEHDDPVDADLAALAEALGEAKEALARRDFAHVAAKVKRLMAQHGLPQAQRDRLALGVLAADVKALEEVRRRTLGEVPAGLLDVAEVVALPVAAPAPEPPAPAKPLVSDLVEPYFERRGKLDRATHQVMGQERGTLRRFMEVCGDRPVDRYGRGDVTGFLDTLRRLPKTYGKSPKDKDRTLAEIIAEADAIRAERLTDKTVKRHLSALSQFFQLALDSGHITNAQRQELVENHRFREERSARNQRDTWTAADLKALFSSPVWKGCASKGRRAEPGAEIIRDAKFWLPILALYHGARLEELADLYRRDVWCDGGTWAIRIVETEDNPDSGSRRLKTKNATRVVPLHPEVIRLGFLEYVRDTAAAPDAPLFPDLAPQGKDGKRGPRITRWFGHYRRAIGIYREGVAHHAFRHTAITRLSDAITTWQQKRHRDFMMGHGGGGTEGDVRYDKGAGLKAAAETLALLRYPEVDLSHLYVRSAEASGSAPADAA
jgi:site-specific recombinase XerD